MFHSNVKAQIDAEDNVIMQQIRPEDWVWSKFHSHFQALPERTLNSLPSIQSNQ